MVSKLTACKKNAAAARAFAVQQVFVCGISTRVPWARLGYIPKTTRESVPSVSEAFLPTASVSGTSMSWRGGSGAAETSEGSLKGSSSPAVEAMVIANVPKASQA